MNLTKSYVILLLVLSCFSERMRAQESSEVEQGDPRVVQQDTVIPTESNAAGQPLGEHMQNAQEIPGQPQEDLQQPGQPRPMPGQPLPQELPPDQPPMRGQGQPLPDGQPLPQGQLPPQDQPGMQDQPSQGQPPPRKPKVFPRKTSVPKPTPVPTPAFTPAPPPPPPPEPEPVAPRKPAGPKTVQQKIYEADMQTRWSAAADEIAQLRSQVSKLEGKKQKAFRESLRTASGNRSIARTKLNQLVAGSSADWDKRKTLVERAFNDLDNSIKRARAHLAEVESSD
ncbi:hypothetical protein [Oligoflexus tunisiensis]|uniref:hypothetical protein n=1 Tax=Oligoflexus tunisiensis TaxID=708132 RepID=UPI00114CBFEC|nr:hypothetical protein [Oligoflexus tunisiensis]